jgi:hypothetical protein
MELGINFRSGTITGEGRDCVGNFLLKGRYSLADGRCYWNKRYIGKHDVSYAGFNEGKGIWGTWEIGAPDLVLERGGFHIWPKDMADAENEVLREALPLEDVMFPEEQEVLVQVSR